MKLNGTMWYDFMIWSEANKVWWVRFLKTKDCDKKLLNSLQTHNIYFTSILYCCDLCLCGVFDGCGGWPTTSYLCQLCWPVGTTYMYNPPMHYNTIFTISCTVITTNKYTRASCLPPLSDRLSQKTPELGHRSFFCGLDRGLMGLWWNYYTSPSWHRQINPSLFEINPTYRLNACYPLHPCWMPQHRKKSQRF